MILRESTLVFQVSQPLHMDLMKFCEACLNNEDSILFEIYRIFGSKISLFFVLQTENQIAYRLENHNNNNSSNNDKIIIILLNQIIFLSIIRINNSYTNNMTKNNAKLFILFKL